MESRFEHEARALRRLGHPVRLAILESLGHQPACVCHLTAALGRPQAYISQQLAILRDAGLVERQRGGAFVYYRLRDHGVLVIVDLASRLRGHRSAAVPLDDPLRSEVLEGCGCPRCSGEGEPTQEGRRRASWQTK
jgi:DNA-binding transcriptional ArsR family regulator